MNILNDGIITQGGEVRAQNTNLTCNLLLESLYQARQLSGHVYVY